MPLTRHASGFALTLLLSLAPVVAATPPPDDDWPPEAWRTEAEASSFASTPSYDETFAFLRRLAGQWPWMRVTFFGSSAQGRPMPAVIVSKDLAFDPERARATGKAIVLVQNGIHSGEIDGKDACLMILRDMALGRDREILDGVILVIVPIYNVDGHERVSRYNRANQDGPVDGMGFRTTADGHDLNRDYLKLSTPEARALVGLFNAWRPDLHVDTHVTNGSDHAWVLTWSWAEPPQIAAEIGTWLESHMPAVSAATAAAGHPNGPYVDLIDRTDPERGIRSLVTEPRYSTGYFPLRNRPSVLIEDHAYKPYRDRVLGVRDYLLALFREIARDPAALRDAVRKADAATVALGKPDAAPSDIVVRWTEAAEDDKVRFPVYDWTVEPSEVLGTPLIHFRHGVVHEVEVPWVHRVAPEMTVRRPRGYLVLPGWPAIEERLRAHGLVVHRLESPMDLDVETFRITNAAPSPRATPSYQGLTPVTFDVARATEHRKFPEGTLWIPADQPDFEVAAQLLEPEAPDSLLSWGLLSSVVELKEWIGPAKLEELAAEMRKDPRVEAEWQAALGDESFAADPWARWRWWYRRTPYWDETVGLLPAMRLMEAVELPLSFRPALSGDPAPRPAAGRGPSGSLR